MDIQEQTPRSRKSRGVDRSGRLRRAGAHVLGIALMLLVLSSCRLFTEDRCYIDNLQYAVAYNLFTESGSLDLVERRLNELQWRRCKVNEALYRLRKEFEVVAPS